MTPKLILHIKFRITDFVLFGKFSEKNLKMEKGLLGTNRTFIYFFPKSFLLVQTNKNSIHLRVLMKSMIIKP